MITIRLAGLAAAACAAASEASAAAFQLREGSAVALGAALAGRTASDADVSLAIQNPAALRGVAQGEVSVGGALIFASGDAATNAGFGPLARTDDPNEDAVVPAFIAGWRVSPEIVLGFAMHAPFGLATEYSSNFVGSFDGVRSELTTINFTPMVSFTPDPSFTVAAGLVLQYADAKLTNRVGIGADPIADIAGDGFDVGFVIGFAAEPIAGTSMGLAIRSGFEHKLEGDLSANFPFPGGRSGEAAFDLPAVVSFGVVQDLRPDLRLMAEVEWTGWSAFDDLTISNDTVTVDDPQNYEDSAFVSFGAEYDVDDRLTIRAGAGYDATPTRDAFRTVRTPDGDRLWLSAGASYDITETVGLDLGYTLILFDDTQVTLRNGPPGVAGERVDYTDSHAHVLQANLRWRF